MFDSINWLAVLLCFLVNVVSGSLWFGPKTFFYQWWQALGRKRDQKPDGSPRTWILLMFSSFLQAFFAVLIVPLIANALGGLHLTNALLAGLLLWVGFVAPSGLVNKLFPGTLHAWALEQGNHLINYLAYGLIIGLLK